MEKRCDETCKTPDDCAKHCNKNGKIMFYIYEGNDMQSECQNPNTTTCEKFREEFGNRDVCDECCVRQSTTAKPKRNTTRRLRRKSTRRPRRKTTRRPRRKITSRPRRKTTRKLRRKKRGKTTRRPTYHSPE